MTTETKKEMFQCFQCKQWDEVKTDGGTGYAIDKNKNKICYMCCGDNEHKSMRETGKAILYLTFDQGTFFGKYGTGKVSNWPGTLSYNAKVKINGHNWWNVKRYDAWFKGPDGFIWHGINLGDNQIIRCKRTKQTSFTGRNVNA